MSKPESEKLFDQVLREHDEIKKVIADLRSFLSSPEPGIGDEGRPAWAASLEAQVTALHGQLGSHFGREDREGLMKGLAIRHPRASRQIDALQADHDAILADMSDLVTAARGLAGKKSPEGLDVCRSLAEILDRLGEHERVETDLITRVEYDDIGTAD